MNHENKLPVTRIVSAIELELNLSIAMAIRKTSALRTSLVYKTLLQALLIQKSVRCHRKEYLLCQRRYERSVG